jgi:CubicO group peptidase (beta-lactamase class C family)
MRKLITVFLLLICVLVPSCTFLKIIWCNFSGIEDYKIFPKRNIPASSNKFHFAENIIPQRVPPKYHDSDFNEMKLEDLLEANNTVAFLIIKNDTLIYEKYFHDYNDTCLSLSFSMAKSFLSMLVGCAIDDVYIKSEYQPVTDFIPELDKNGFSKVRIKHLLQMTSGMDYKESDNPFGIHTHFYYGNDLEDKLIHLKLKNEPGKIFEYKSGDYQLLGLILSRAIKPLTITEYLHQRLWEPMGMEYDGLWNIDRDTNGLEKTFCCLAARARDYAKIGRLYLNKGNWNGKQLISQSWVETSTQIDTTEGSAWYYQYGWWLSTREPDAFTAKGHLGQYIYFNPRKQIVIVRLGKSNGKFYYEKWLELFKFLSDSIL